MKKIITLFLSFILLTACKATTTQKQKTIYTTFFPVTQLTKMIVKDNYDIKTIIQASQDPHAFELTIQKRKELEDAPLIIYNGANMESFIPDLIQDSTKEKFLDLSQGLTLLNNKNNAETNKVQTNPHTWLSIKNAMIMLDTIYQKMISIDSENQATYQKNYNEALQKLQALDKKFESTIQNIQKSPKYFVVSHAAFNYLANDYQLKQIAVSGISPEDEPSAAQLKTIADFVKEKNISTIFFEGKATPKVAETLANSTQTKTDTLYTMENLNESEIAIGYIGLMEKNLNALIKSWSE